MINYVHLFCSKLQVKAEIIKKRFKPNCVLVILQFLLKHGLISPSEGEVIVKLLSDVIDNCMYCASEPQP